MQEIIEWIYINLLSRQGLLTLAAIGGGGLVVQFTRDLFIKRAVAAKRRKKYEETRSGIQDLEQRLANAKISKERVEFICGLGTTELLKQLHSGDIRPLEALHAFQIKTLETNKITNCVVEFIKEAEVWACEREANTEKGPLHGLPICVKDDYGIQGYDSVVGCACFIGKPFKDDATVIKVLKQQGAVPFVKTNVPQTMISYETSNPVFGTTVNYRDPTRGVGGSSGGTGVLIASAGVAIGLGSDLGGSIRVPAHMNGVCGFKQTGGRTSCDNTQSVINGSELVKPAFGPLAKDVDGLVTAMRSLCSPLMFKLDATLPPLPFDEKEFGDKRKLKIGYFTYNGVMHALPPCERAVYVTTEALEKLGHTVIEFKLPFHITDVLLETMGLATTADGGYALLNLLKYDKQDKKALGIMPFFVSLPRWFKRLLSIVMKPIDPKLSEQVAASLAIQTIGDYWKVTHKIQRTKKAFMEEWEKHDLDAMISPASSVPPMPIGSVDTLYVTGSYPSLWNVVNYPTGVLPVTCVNDADRTALSDYPTNSMPEKLAKESMKNIGALPVGVQVTTLPWKEELCLRIMKQLEDQIQFKPS